VARFGIASADTLANALDQVSKEAFDVVLLDLGLPDSQGLETFLEFQRAARDVPVIVLSGLDDESLAIEAVRQGSQDYLVKDRLDTTLLSRSIVQAIERQLLLIKLRDTERSLRESEQRFRAIFEGTQDCIYLQDQSLRFMLVNPAVEKLFGLPASEIGGLKEEDLFGEINGSMLREIGLRVLEGASIEDESTRKVKGVLMTFLETRTPLRDSRGDVIGICTVSRDITERKQILPAGPGIRDEYPSKAMKDVLATSRMAAEKDSTILLLGESGSGKDHLARYIHAHSRRAGGPFFAINCAALTPTLAESELFGHERGAFTGAQSRKRGLLELAEGGTLLLNEIGELSLPLQAKLLTFLDTRKFTRVGGEKEISTHARLLAATNRDLAKEVEEGKFRHDLYFRLTVMVITVPPLRERPEDIPSIVEEIMSSLRRDMQISTIPVLEPETLRRMKAYHWPGNVRELRNVLERALILSGGQHCRSVLDDLPDGFGRSPQGKAPLDLSFEVNDGLHDATDELTLKLCEDALRASGGNKKAAAKALGISRDTLYRYLKKFGLQLQKK